MKGLLFTYLLTFGGAASGLVSPFTGLLVYIAFSILRPESLWFWAVPEGNYSRIVAIALLAGWALRGFGNWRFGRATAVVWSFIGFFLWSMICAAAASDQTVAWRFVDMLSKIFLPFLVGITTIDSVAKLKQLAWTIVLAEGYLSYEMNMRYFGGYNMAQEGFGDMGRSVLGIGLVASLGVAFFLSFSARQRWKSCLAGGCAALIGHVIFLTYSRGAVIALLAMAAFVFWLIPKQPKHWSMLLVAVAMGVVMAGPSVRERFSTTFAEAEDRDASAQSRLDLWRDCLAIIAKHPVTGVGPDHFGLVAPEYGWKSGKEAHSLWLQNGAELGVPGMSFLITFYLLTATRLWGLTKMYGRSAEPAMPMFAAMVVSALTGFAVGSLFVTVTRLELPYYIALLGAGVLKLCSPSAAAAALPRIPRTRYAWSPIYS